VRTRKTYIIIVKDKTIKLLELTVPTNTVENITSAQMRKQTKPNYIALTNDIEAVGFSVDLDTLEVGSLGHFTKEAITTFKAILPMQNRQPISKLLFELSKIAVACSANIFQARRNTNWNSNTPLIHPFTPAPT